MYPGTYQPLQALSLLLADLLQYPHADEASESRGLVDAAFDLYQADEGIVSQNSPPRRKLSSSGKDAWSILSRTRKKALANINQDPYVLIPSPKVFSDFCICGERISRSRQSVRDDPVLTNSHGHNVAFPPNSQDAPDDYRLTPGPMLMENADFDWQEWDYSLGISTGMLP